MPSGSLTRQPPERPASAVMPRAVVNAARSGACAQLVVSNARHCDLLMRFLATSSRHSSHKRCEIETTMGGVVQQLLSTTEPATLDRVARTWAELDHYCRGDMAPSSLAAFRMGHLLAFAKPMTRLSPPALRWGPARSRTTRSALPSSLSNKVASTCGLRSPSLRPPIGLVGRHSSRAAPPAPALRRRRCRQAWSRRARRPHPPRRAPVTGSACCGRV